MVDVRTARERPGALVADRVGHRLWGRWWAPPLSAALLRPVSVRVSGTDLSLRGRGLGLHERRIIERDGVPVDLEVFVAALDRGHRSA